ncbi:hypothetical protein PCE1_000207 [Barthelona sp. PCE]
MPRRVQRDNVIFPYGIEKPIRLQKDINSVRSIILEDTDENSVIEDVCFLELSHEREQLAPLHRAFDGTLFFNNFNGSTLSGSITFYTLEQNFDVTVIDTVDYSLPHVVGPRSFMDSNVCVFSRDVIIYTFFGDHSALCEIQGHSSCSFAYDIREQKLTFLCEGMISTNDENSCVVAYCLSKSTRAQFITPKLTTTTMPFRSGFTQVGVANLGVSAIYAHNSFVLVNRYLEYISLGHLVKSVETRRVKYFVLLTVTKTELTMLCIRDDVSNYCKYVNGKLELKVQVGNGFDMLFFPISSENDPEMFSDIKRGEFKYHPMLALGRQKELSGLFKFNNIENSAVCFYNIENFDVINNQIHYKTVDSEVFIDFVEKKVFSITHLYKSSQLNVFPTNNYVIVDFYNGVYDSHDEKTRESVDLSKGDKHGFVTKHKGEFESFVYNFDAEIRVDTEEFCCYFRNERLCFNDENKAIELGGKFILEDKDEYRDKLCTDEQTYVCFCSQFGSHGLVILYDEESDSILVHETLPGIRSCHKSPYDDKCLLLLFEHSSRLLMIENGFLNTYDGPRIVSFVGWISFNCFASSLYLYSVQGGIISEEVYLGERDCLKDTFRKKMFTSHMTLHIIDSEVSSKEGFLIRHVEFTGLKKNNFGANVSLENISFERIFEEFEFSVNEIIPTDK